LKQFIPLESTAYRLFANFSNSKVSHKHLIMNKIQPLAKTMGGIPAYVPTPVSVRARLLAVA
jgi:hypothetical protein